MAQCTTMSAPKYTLCKHCPNCRRYSIGNCGFAHSLQDVSLPHRYLPPNRWVDESHESGGRAAPDLFVGQKYTFSQQARVLAYVARSDPPYPPWVNLYLWLLRHPRYIPDHRHDLGWYSSVKELIAAGLLPNACIRSLYDADSLLEWIPPWMYCKVMLGEDFQNRMKYRLANAIEYPLMIAIHAFT